MYGRNEVEIPHHYLVGGGSSSNLGELAERVNPSLPKIMRNEVRNPTSSEHYNDAACSGGEKVSGRLLLVVAASKERQQHDRITYSTMFIQILCWFYVHSK